MVFSALDNKARDLKQIMIRFKPFGTRGTTAVAAPQISPADPNAKWILIVDDDPVFVKATSNKLRAAGFNVTAARDSSEAIAALTQNPTDAVLMDIDFPPDVANGGMGSWDGFQLMTWLRGLFTSKCPRFIMVSSSDSPEFRARAEKLGVVAYLQKPLSSEQLLTALGSAL